MEQTRTLPRPTGGGSGDASGGEGLEQLRVSLDGILGEADRILDGMKPINAEEYLQQNRQRGGQ